MCAMCGTFAAIPRPMTALARKNSRRVTFFGINFPFYEFMKSNAVNRIYLIVSGSSKIDNQLRIEPYENANLKPYSG